MGRSSWSVSSADDRYKPNKQTRFKTSILRSDLCYFNDAYILVKGAITVTDPDNDAYDKELTLKISHLLHAF